MGEMTSENRTGGQRKTFPHYASHSSATSSTPVVLGLVRSGVFSCHLMRATHALVASGISMEM